MRRFLIAVAILLVLLLIGKLITMLIAENKKNTKKDKVIEADVKTEEVKVVEEVSEVKTEEKVEEKPEVVTEVVAETKEQSEPDDLKKIEGVGPKIEFLLNEADIKNYAELASAEFDTLKQILDNAGKKFQMHDPSTWSKQAALARDGKWDDLKTYQDEI